MGARWRDVGPYRRGMNGSLDDGVGKFAPWLCLVGVDMLELQANVFLKHVLKRGGDGNKNGMHRGTADGFCGHGRDATVVADTNTLDLAGVTLLQCKHESPCLRREFGGPAGVPHGPSELALRGVGADQTGMVASKLSFLVIVNAEDSHGP